MEKVDLNSVFRTIEELNSNIDLPYAAQIINHSGNLANLLNKHKIQLYLTREYEHQLVRLTSENEVLIQDNITIPHPCGLAFDGQRNLWVACTRNPNQLLKLDVFNGFEVKEKHIVPGDFYLHDLVFKDDELWSSITGKDALGNWDFSINAFNVIQLKSELKNQHQINSVSFINNECYYTLSCSEPQENLPGSQGFQVDQLGAIQNQQGDNICDGLTRPHSLRFWNGKLWVNNSGYGAFGYVEDGVFVPVYRTGAWTRGLAFFGDYAFIGLSKILPRFKHYAPGVKGGGRCGLVVIDLNSFDVIAEVEWPEGDQHFGIEVLELQ